MSALSCRSGYGTTLFGGIFDLNDFDSTFFLYTTAAGTTTYLGNGILTLTYAASFAYSDWSMSGTLFCEGSTIKLNHVGTGNITFLGNGKVYNKIWLSGTLTGNYLIGGANTIASLTIDAGRKVQFQNGITQQIANFVAIGTQANPITIATTTSATHTLNFTGSGIVEAEWLNITNSIATPANTWYAGSSSVNGGNNTGWIFDVAFTPVIMWF